NRVNYFFRFSLNFLSWRCLMLAWTNHSKPSLPHPLQPATFASFFTPLSALLQQGANYSNGPIPAQVLFEPN
ncbi:hypothetical protein, partial [Herbaspirillum sp. YR522]|uniref:hypothetical protein n=1 Tax=Herbaspirillum sp. YR522 TaxID=1144342 RepID=UPI001EE66068